MRHILVNKWVYIYTKCRGGNPTVSPYSSPAWLVPKPDGWWGPVDCRTRRTVVVLANGLGCDLFTRENECSICWVKNHSWGSWAPPMPVSSCFLHVAPGSSPNPVAGWFGSLAICPAFHHSGALEYIPWFHYSGDTLEPDPGMTECGRWTP